MGWGEDVRKGDKRGEGKRRWVVVMKERKERCKRKDVEDRGWGGRVLGE